MATSKAHRQLYSDLIPGSGESIEISVAEVAALNAVVDGRSTPDQAKLAIEWVMREACRINDLSFKLGGLDGQRASDFASGRQYVGYMIRRAISPEFYRTRSGVAEDRARHT